MTDPINNTVKVKEKKLKTTVYFHDCPECGDSSDSCEDSLVGEKYECFCGVMLEIVK